MKIKFLKRPKKRQSKFPPCEICLISYGNVLLPAQQKNLVAQADESLLTCSAVELAQAARRVLPNTDKKKRIALALPNSEFVATTLNLPAAIDPQSLKNAVNLQLPILLPGISDALLVAVQVQPKGEPTCALWLTVKRAEELFQEFDKVNLFLACILPRGVLTIPKTPTTCQIYDEDEHTITCFEWSGNAIGRWLHVSKVDCQDPSFKHQWEESLTALRNDIHQEWKTELNDWKSLSMPPASAYGYAFVPPSATLKMEQVAQQKKRRWLQVMLGFLVFCLLASVVAVIRYEHRLQKRLKNLENLTVDIRQLQTEVIQIEEDIGLVKHFPNHQVTWILERLNQLIPKDSWITGFRVEAGKIEFEGYSPNPAELVSVLLTEEQFIEVEPSQPTVGTGGGENRFGISFRLKDVNFKDYWLEYFPIRN